MKLYVVEIKSAAVVLAKDKAHAKALASGRRGEIVGNDLEADIEVKHQVKSLADLPAGYSEDDCPYGDDESATIGEILEP